MADVRIRNVRVRIRGGSAEAARQSVPQLREAVARALSGTAAVESRPWTASRIATPIAGAVRGALKGSK